MNTSERKSERRSERQRGDERRSEEVVEEASLTTDGRSDTMESTHGNVAWELDALEPHTNYLRVQGVKDGSNGSSL